MAKKSNGSRLWFLGAFLLWLASYLVIRFILKLENGNAGTFGDQFGAINALFTGLSFAGIIITLRLQQEELSAQRREFMTSRAMTIVYKQIDLVEKVMDKIKFIKPSNSGSWDPNEIRSEYIGVFALKECRKETFRNNSQLNIEAFKDLMLPLISSIANSVQILSRVKVNENMVDFDSLIIYQTFYYNLNNEIREYLEYTYSIYRNYSEDEEFRNNLYAIETFKTELKELENQLSKSYDKK